MFDTFNAILRLAEQQPLVAVTLLALIVAALAIVRR